MEYNILGNVTHTMFFLFRNLWLLYATGLISASLQFWIPIAQRNVTGTSQTCLGQPTSPASGVPISLGSPIPVVGPFPKQHGKDHSTAWASQIHLDFPINMLGSPKMHLGFPIYLGMPKGHFLTPCGKPKQNGASYSKMDCIKLCCCSTQTVNKSSSTIRGVN